MENGTIVLGLMIVLALVFFFLMDRRWRKRVDEAKTDPTSQAMWALMQQQMDQLRGQMSEGRQR